MGSGQLFFPFSRPSSLPLLKPNKSYIGSFSLLASLRIWRDQFLDVLLAFVVIRDDDESRREVVLKAHLYQLTKM
jgi:hypothetical protein